MTRRGIRVARLATCSLAWVLFVASAWAGGLRAQPFAPGPQTPPPPGGQPFVPQPGAPPQAIPPQRIAEVVVRGNTNIPTDQILAAVSSKVNDPLNQDKLNSDVQAILNLGYFADAVVRLEPVPDGVRVVFLVVENPVVKAVEVKGNSVISTDEILRALGVPTGQVLNTVAARTGARAIEKLYQDKGYSLARVSDVSVSPEGTLTVTVAEGRIEAITFEGLHKTKEYVARRELTFKPGDIFNVNAVNASLKKLFQLQYFSDVRAQPGPGTQPDTVNVTIVVTEQRTSTLSLGVGYGTVTGLLGSIGWRDTDFGGNGQSVQVQYSTTVLFGTSFAIAFHEPSFYGTHTVMDAEVFNQTTIPTDYSLGLGSSFQYNLTQTGGFLSFTQPMDPINSLTYGVRVVNSLFGPPSVGTAGPAGFPFTPGAVVAPILGVIQDTRNDPLFPTSGERISLTGEFAVQSLGGDFSFQKYELDYAHFFPLGGADTTIAAHAHLGYSAVALPIQEQFYLGGQTTLRGFANGRFRGDESALFQVEYRFPLSALPFLSHFTGITTVLFVDFGDAEPVSAGFGSFTLKPDVGFGIQVKTPLGPFRLDYGTSSEGGQLWVTTGATF